MVKPRIYKCSIIKIFKFKISNWVGKCLFNCPPKCLKIWSIDHSQCKNATKYDKNDKEKNKKLSQILKNAIKYVHKRAKKSVSSKCIYQANKISHYPYYLDVNKCEPLRILLNIICVSPPNFWRYHLRRLIFISFDWTFPIF